MSKRYSIGVATVIALVLLRLTIGWHFFSEGVKHYADPRWTSEPVLRAAKGPLAPWFQAYVPNFHGFDDMLHGDGKLSESHAVQAWLDQVETDWDEFRGHFEQHYTLDEAQQKQAQKVLAEIREKLRQWVAANRDSLETHVHEWQRKETAHEAPAREVPFQKKRIAEKQSTLTSQANAWRAELKGVERDYEDLLVKLLNEEQRYARPPLVHHAASIDTVDHTMTYVILGVGLLLLLGLFTRLACVIGAIFLLSVVMMQPFWLPDAVPTYNQYLEMLALLTLATVPVGRWCGLDFFVQSLITGSSNSTKGKSDVLES